VFSWKNKRGGALTGETIFVHRYWLFNMRGRRRVSVLMQICRDHMTSSTRPLVAACIHGIFKMPTNATIAKDRLYAQLAASLGRMSRAVAKTGDLCEQLQVDLNAMRTFAGLDAAKCRLLSATTLFPLTHP